MSTRISVVSAICWTFACVVAATSAEPKAKETTADLAGMSCQITTKLELEGANASKITYKGVLKAINRKSVTLTEAQTQTTRGKHIFLFGVMVADEWVPVGSDEITISMDKIDYFRFLKD